MLDMSWGEVMVIGAVALIVIGPKDLPKALRTVGQVTAKVRRMAGEFHTQFNDAMREADLDEVRKDLEAVNRNVMASTSTGFNPIQTIRDELKGAVEAKPVTSPPPTPPVAWDHSVTPTVTEVVPSSPELAISASAEVSSTQSDALVVEEIGAPPAMAPIVASEPHHAHVASPPVDLTGPGLEQAPTPVPTPSTHQGHSA
jgi:sec-independent protein translocase protein TatB